MRLTVTLSYTAPPARVAAMLADPGFQARLCAATGDPRATVEVTGEQDAPRVRTARRLPTDRFPSAIKALVGEEVTAVQTTHWAAADADGSRRGEVSVVVEGTPVRLAATARIEPAAQGTRVTYDGDLTAKVPLVSGKVERAADPVVRSALEAEQRVGEEWLAAHPA